LWRAQMHRFTVGLPGKTTCRLVRIKPRSLSTINPVALLEPAASVSNARVPVVFNTCKHIQAQVLSLVMIAKFQTIMQSIVTGSRRLAKANRRSEKVGRILSSG
jgi:hypothetical protein